MQNNKRRSANATSMYNVRIYNLACTCTVQSLVMIVSLSLSYILIIQYMLSLQRNYIFLL